MLILTYFYLNNRSNIQITMFGCFHFQNIRPEKLILAWKSAENNVHFPPLKLTGFSLAKKLPGEGTVLVKATFLLQRNAQYDQVLQQSFQGRGYLSKTRD